MKVAITHDYLIDFGGAERVLLALHEIYPEAPIYTLIYRKNKLGEFGKKFEKAKIKESWFGKFPGADKLISPFRFLVPFLWKVINLSKYDLIIDSSSWAITRGFKRSKKQIEICYCHTPPRYLYGYDTSRNWKDKWYGGLVGNYSKWVNKFLMAYDYWASQQVDYFVANSKNVAERIKKFYGRDSVVIYPPVDLGTSTSHIRQDYFLTGGRLVAAKNFDLIIRACKKAGVSLKIFGRGIQEGELRQIAGEECEFLGKVADEELKNLYVLARAFIVAQKDEDFGITTVEAQAMGCPVIAYKGGGYLETVVDGKTGVLFDDLSVENLVKAINKFKKIKWNRRVIENNAMRFSGENFKKNFLSFVGSVIKG